MAQNPFQKLPIQYNFSPLPNTHTHKKPRTHKNPHLIQHLKEPCVCVCVLMEKWAAVTMLCTQRERYGIKNNWILSS